MQTYDAYIAVMKTPAYLGEFEYAVLLAVLQLRDDAYAVPIRELIEGRTGRAVARGRALHRARTTRGQGLREVGAARRQRRTRRAARRYFTVTPTGLAALRTTHAALRSLATGLESILEQP